MESSVTGRFALVYNPRSRRNMGDKSSYAPMARSLLGENFIDPADRSLLDTAIAQLAARDMDCIVVDGGDGTVSDVLTAIHRHYAPARFPALAILPSGNTNLIAGDVGFGLRGQKALDRLVSLAAAGTLRGKVRRRCGLVVEWPEAEGKPAVVGMFHGAAAFTRGIELAHQPAILNNYSHEMAVVVSFLSSVAHLFTRRSRREWMQGNPITLRAGEQPEWHGNCFLFLSSTLQRLPHGIWPFWNVAGGRTDVINYLHVAGQPPRLAAAAWALLRGRHPAWLRHNPDYCSGCEERIEMALESDFVLDGEVFSPGASGRIVLSATAPIDFIHA
ncbi:diacylglycerol/lipid kinase family protein [Komagataeibacter sucrofermentans]|uniref:diacylglycerol/lipid kinase family protein n=2 Tax=Komagataeibacter sucrofermentans TaxID=1053551 RepID=UPI00223282FE|nr:acylglycerol kinase family protein [Komagataeibacter sucrofermentans]